MPTNELKERIAKIEERATNLQVTSPTSRFTRILARLGQLATSVTEQHSTFVADLLCTRIESGQDGQLHRLMDAAYAAQLADIDDLEDEIVQMFP